MTQLVVQNENEFDRFPCGWLKGNLFSIKNSTHQNHDIKHCTHSQSVP